MTTRNQPYPFFTRARSALAAIALVSSVGCFGGWQVPLEPGTPGAGSATPGPDASGMPQGDGNTSIAPTQSPLPTDPTGDANATAAGNANTMGNGNTCQPIADFFAAQMWTPVMSTTCVSCHQDTSNPFHLTAGDPTASLTATEAEAKKTGANNTSLLLLKPSGQTTHGGGMVLSTTSSTYMAFMAFVTAVQANASCVTPP